MAQNWHSSQYGLPPFQNTTTGGSYNGQAPQGTGNPAMSVQQNPQFQQTTQIPSMNPLGNTDPAHIAALLQQLQAAGYPLPPLPATSYPNQQPHPPLAGQYTAAAGPDGPHVEDEMRGKAASEEGELSEGEEKRSSSEYDPAQPAFDPIAASKRDEARRRLSDERRYDRYNGGAQRLRGETWNEGNQHFATSAQESSRPATPRDIRRGAYSPVQSQPLPALTPSTYQTQQVMAQEMKKDSTSEILSTTQTAKLTGANELIEQIITNLAPSSATEKSAQSLADQSEHARNFVSLLSFYGVVFQSLIKETYFNQNTDWGHLAKIYADLNLPLPAEQNSRQDERLMGHAKSGLVQYQGNGEPSLGGGFESITSETNREMIGTERTSMVSGRAPPQSLPATAQPSVSAAGQSKLAHSSTAAGKSPLPAESRAAYLAKLKAAKMKVGKPGEGGTKSASASATPPVQTKGSEPQAAGTTSPDTVMTNAAPADISKGEEAAATARAQAETEARKKRQTELLQQRLAALKAKQAISISTKPVAGPPDVHTVQHVDVLPQTPSALAQVSMVDEISVSSSAFPGLRMSDMLEAQASSNVVGHVTADANAQIPATTSLNTSKKRPVAADFEDFKVTPTRPLKQARSYVEESQDQYEPMVIDVSDEEAESDNGGVGIQDDVTDFIRTTADAVEAQQGRPLGNVRGTGAFPDFPPQRSASNTSSLLGTPGGVSTPGNVEYGLQLAKSELQIAEMKAKIAARQALQRRKLNSSRPETPQKAHNDPENLQAGLTDSIKIANASPTALPAPSISASTSQQFPASADPESVQEQHPSPAASMDVLVVEASAQQANESSSVPAASTALLEGQGAQAALSVFANAMPGLRQTAAAKEASAREPASVAAGSVSDASDEADSETDDEELYTTNAADADPKQSPFVTNEEDEFEMSDDSKEADDSDVLTQPSATTSGSKDQPGDSALAPTQPDAPNNFSIVTHAGQPQRPDQQQDDRLAIHEDAEVATSNSPGETGEDGDDDDDFYEAAPPATQDPATNHDHSDSDPHEPSSPISLSEGDDDSDMVENGADKPTTTIQASDTDASAEDDFYEPVEDIPQQARISEAASIDDPFGADDDEYDPASASPGKSVETSTDSSISESPRSSHVDDLRSNNANSEGSEQGVGYAEPSSSNRDTELPADEVAPSAQPIPINTQPVEITADQPHYQPYQSPLRMFKDYRYHPQYNSDVQGGYRSMTYSHQIDANRPVCPYEADGGICNDPDCQGQHFKGMQLSDDMILVQLGTKNPGRDPAEKTKWNDGLREVLKQLRLTNTRDPDKVAAAIAGYRRTFLQDPTRVLHM